jgi:epoxyqueuosine reductase QueG
VDREVPCTPEAAEERLREVAGAEGIDVFGVTAVEQLWEGHIRLEPKEAYLDLTYGIVMGYRLSGALLEGIVNGPTLLYKHHYQRVNLLLDRSALRIAGEIQRWGYKSLPIAASQLIDWERLLGHLSHRSVGALAGLGWIGRSTLLVHPEFGAQVRYVTVLTNLPLPFGSPLEMDCGECRKCIEVCPAGAIRERKEDFQVRLCYEKLNGFAAQRGIGVHICGLCVKACNGKR